MISPRVRCIGPTFTRANQIIMASRKSDFCSYSRPALQYLEISPGRKIAYRQLKGEKMPGLILFSGYKSTMDGTKALAIEDFCKEFGYPYTRFDYEGSGESIGSATVCGAKEWIEDGCAVLEKLTNNKQMLIGSSMGAAIASHVALRHPDRLHSIVGIASAINLTLETLKIPLASGPSMNERLNDVILMDQRLLEALLSAFHHPEDKPLKIDCPVRMIHGMNDDIVPYKMSLLFSEMLTSSDVDVILRKNGQHRFSEPEDIKLIISTIKQLLHI